MCDPKATVESDRRKGFPDFDAAIRRARADGAAKRAAALTHLRATGVDLVQNAHAILDHGEAGPAVHAMIDLTQPICRAVDDLRALGLSNLIYGAAWPMLHQLCLGCAGGSDQHAADARDLGLAVLDKVERDLSALEGVVNVETAEAAEGRT